MVENERKNLFSVKRRDAFVGTVILSRLLLNNLIQLLTTTLSQLESNVSLTNRLHLINPSSDHITDSVECTCEHTFVRGSSHF